MSDDERESGTMPAALPAEERDTMPPSAPVPRELLESLEPSGFDPNKWEHYKIAKLVEGLDLVRNGLKALAPSELEKLIERTASVVAARFRPIVEESERRIMSEVGVVARNHARTVDDVTNLRLEFAASMALFETRIAKLEEEG